MNKFNFRLEKVENNKSEKVKQKTHKLTELFSHQENLRKKISNLKSELSNVQKTNLVRIVDGCLIKDLVNTQKYIKKLTKAVKNANDEQESVDDRIEELHISLLKLDKEKKILEKLREKRHLEYVQAQNREEQILLDETYLLTKEIKKIL